MFRAIHRPMTPARRLALLLLAAGCLTSPVHAAPAEQETGTDDKNAGAAEETASQDGTSAEVFIPTEEISEDFAVAFPVDI